MNLSTDQLSEDIHRTLPASHDAEQGTLCSILLTPRCIEDCQGRITPEHFHNPAHRLIYVTMSEHSQKRIPGDIIALTGTLIDRKQLDAAGGPAYLAELQTIIPTSANLSHYLEMMRDKYGLREIIKAATTACNDAYNAAMGDGGCLDVAATLERQVRAVAERAAPTVIESIGAQFADWVDSLDPEIEEDSPIITGMAQVDECVVQLDLGDTTVIAARPGMGKTAMMLQIFRHAVFYQGIDTALVSLEMTKNQVFARIAANDAEIYVGKFRNKTTRKGFSPLDWTAIEAMGKRVLATKNMHMWCAGGLDVDQIVNYFRAIQRDRPLKLGIIDYAQIVRPTRASARKNNREQEISEISSTLKAAALNLNMHIILGAQVNRESEKGTNPRALRISDLRESGTLEQDAANVILVYGDKDKDERTVNVGKGRHSDTGEFSMRFNKGFQRFEYMPYQPDEPPSPAVNGHRRSAYHD